MTLSTQASSRQHNPPFLKKNPVTLFVTLLVFLLGESRAQNSFKAADLVGDWVVSEKTAIITFFADGDRFYGMTSWMKRPKDENGNVRTDIHNPDPSKRSQPLLGALLCRNFRYHKDGVWVDGTIYDSRNGRTYNARITMKDINTISLRGYIGISLIGGSTVWTRKQK
jgi:uncharacterized protein (DUF2147 family)